MGTILSIASVTFKESIRNRTVLGILVLAVGFVVSALLLAALALDERVRVIKDWGLFCVSAFGVLLAVLLGVNQVHKEVRRKSLYVVLTRALPRWKYVVGKYLGLALTLLVEFGALSLALGILLAIEKIPPDVLLIEALLLSLVEILLVAAVAVFFASFSSPYLSGLFTLGIFVVGRTLPVLKALAGRIDFPPLKTGISGLVWVLPDLASFNISTQAVHGLEVPPGDAALLTAYGFGYLALLLALSAWIFSRRDLT
jgi:ABC-type transport system involved in multi-copper enzyme maturation permease subunit